MSLVRCGSPSRGLSPLNREIGGLLGKEFDEFFGSSGLSTWTPAIDLFESEGEYILRADIPGVLPDDVSIELEDDILAVTGERTTGKEDRAEGYYRFERGHGQFKRAVRLPRGVDPESVKAHFDSGVLEVRIPKPSHTRKHRITVEGDSAPDVE